MMAISTTPFTVNGRTYRPPARPIVVVCIDGSADEYLDAAMARGRLPNLQRLGVNGYRGMARAAMPTFTNVNNASIVTGVPPMTHGIGGNFFFDPTSGEEVMMNSAKFLRAETIFPAAARAGRKVAVVTAKDKLRDIFAHGLVSVGGIAFSSEKADQSRIETHGISSVEQLVGHPVPPIYSAAASLFVLWSGVALLRKGMADLLYLSTTDYMQHKFAPTEPDIVEFYGNIDHEIGRLLQLGAIVGITADHGMNAKQKPDGTPNVIYLGSELTSKFGSGFRVILPITDPYVAHHGALGSFAVIHLPLVGTPSRRQQLANEVRSWLMELPGVTEVYDRELGARKLELPADRLGELLVISGRDVVLGRSKEHHDLTALEGGLRSHGGRYEEMVPFLFSGPLQPEYAAKAAGDPRNFDVFDYTMNGVKP